jgi:hypothetical protein
VATFYTDADLAGAGEFSDPELTLATEFTVPDGQVNWLRWRCPSAAPGVTPAFRIYDASNNVVATVPLDGAVVTSAWNQGTPASPIALTAGTYRAAINTTTYLARANFFSGGPITRGDITGVQGRFANGIAAPGGGSNSAYFVDIDFGDPGPAEGTAAVGLGLAVSATGANDREGSAALGLGLAVAATGAADREGTAALGLNLAVAASGATDREGVAALGLGLAVAATGANDREGSAALGLGLAVSATGSAPSVTPASGTVALGLDLSPSATGERGSSGSAALGLGLAPVAAGARGASGEVALGLGLEVSATGSNGDTGRPVTPWPWTPRPVSSYPWTPRPVKSFQEVES